MTARDAVWTTASGLGLGVALVLGGLTQPATILGWVDWFGAWDPTLIVFFAGAVLVYHGAYRLALARDRRRATPCLDLPPPRAIDARLLGGAAVFGVGWALGGTCPGPALSSLGAGAPWALVFVGAMLVGLRLGKLA
ncbi:MAG TPA: DUF6691 family protein [Polyangiaceae bacterium]